MDNQTSMGRRVDIRTYMANVPNMSRFFTVDELHQAMRDVAEQYPDRARLRRVGTSRLGEPLHLLSIGSGRKNAFIFGMPHPNEPIGAMMVVHLTRLLCEDAALRDALDYTWHFIPTVDPDGSRLNEGWFAGPFRRSHYARHFFRPAGHQQVEWTFPFSYKRAFFDAILPETLALMRVIDELQPEFMYSLHNAEYGGVYYYLSRPAEPLYELLGQLPGWEGLPLHLGEPEMPMLEPVAPAVFIMPSKEQMYDWIEQYGGDPAKRESGGSSDSYARKYGTLTLIVEMPYWDDPRANDLTPTSTNRRAALREAIAKNQALLDDVDEVYTSVAPDLKTVSPFRLSIEATIADMREFLEQSAAWAEATSDTDRPATVAELFSSADLPHMFRLRTGGQLVRMLEGEVAIGNATPAIREGLARARERFEQWCAEADAFEQGRPIPIRKLVAVQLGAALTTAEYIQGLRAVG
jgi:hypothetical protein